MIRSHVMIFKREIWKKLRVDERGNVKVKKLIILISCKEVVKYVASSSGGAYDLLFYLIFTVQTSFLPSIPSGYHSPNNEGWLAFYISIVFFFLFYPLLYFKFYRHKDANFIREIVIFSVVARFNSFVYVGCIAVIQLGLWSFFKLPKLNNASLIYYLLYYATFAALMFFCKKDLRSALRTQNRHLHVIE